MTEQEPEYLTDPDDVDMEVEEGAIRRGTTIALLLTMAGYSSAYYLLPMTLEFPVALEKRLATGAVASFFVVIWVLIGVMMVSTARRSSPDDIGGAAAGPPSEKVAIKAAFLQNTLEQAVIAVAFFAALCAVAGGAWLALLPVAVVFFAVGRVLFYRGYPRGAKGRAFGMGLTMTPSLVGYVVVIGLLLTRV